MNKNLIFVLVALTTLLSCGNNSKSPVNEEMAVTDAAQCNFKNIKQHKMFAYSDRDGDTLYFDNSFKALWPEMINGKPCPVLQQALLRSMTDSAELNKLDIVIEFLLNPSSYTECDSKRLIPIKAVKDDENKLSTSEVEVTLESMTDRLITYRLATYSYMAGGAHGIYANNYTTYDLLTENAVALSDVIADTTLLRSTILKSIKQVNNYDKDDLFIPDNGLLPLPGDFYIQDHVLHVVYQVYEIASYAQGMIDAPIYPYLLKPEEMKRLFTPYGLELIDYTE
ncbi:MAG: DUF3298 domain-containing protein [Muribaculaceae bacterium]|nr:DUF3298 domain-containing protein [Muribaculaceae bacterium]